MHSRTSHQGKGEVPQLQQLLHQMSLQMSLSQMSLQREKRVRRMLLSHQEVAVTTRLTQSWAFLPCLPQCHKVTIHPSYKLETHFKECPHIEDCSQSSPDHPQFSILTWVTLAGAWLHALHASDACYKLGLTAACAPHAGNIAAWKKKEGEEVAAGDSIAEIETDKVSQPVLP